MPINENMDDVAIYHPGTQEMDLEEYTRDEISLGNSIVFKIGDKEITFWQLLIMIVLFLILVK